MKKTREKEKRIGILTGGGDCPGLNAVIRAVAKSALSQGWTVLGFKDGYKGLVENNCVRLENRDVSGIIVKGGTILGTNNKANPFRYTLPPFAAPGSPRNLSKKAFSNFRKNKMSALITIGGDGTLTMAERFFRMGIPVVAVPKTIDNDLSGTDLTFGFDSALDVATDAVDKLHSTAESHHRILLVETMGRYAGWIALRAGLAGGGDVILIPEIPYKVSDVIEFVQLRKKRGKNFSIIVVAEGAKPEKGEMTVMKILDDSPDPVRLGGVSYTIADAFEKRTCFESRVVVLGHLQRGGRPTPFDRWLATGFGVKAVELIKKNKFGYMAAFRDYDFREVKIAKAVGKLKRINARSSEIMAALSVGTSFGNFEVEKKLMR